LLKKKRQNGERSLEVKEKNGDLMLGKGGEGREFLSKMFRKAVGEDFGGGERQLGSTRRLVTGSGGEEAWTLGNGIPSISTLRERE